MKIKYFKIIFTYFLRVLINGRMYFYIFYNDTFVSKFFVFRFVTTENFNKAT